MKKTILVIGLGRLGTALCHKIIRLGHSVMAVDKTHSKVGEIADTVDLAVQLDATDEDALSKMGAKNADIAIVAIGENLEASVLATSILRDFGIPKIVARAQTNLHAKILAKVGANKIVFPEKDTGERLAELLINPWLSSFSSLPGSNLLVGSVSPLPEMLGKTLIELNFRNTYNAIVLCIRRGEATLLPKADTLLQEGDSLVLAGKEEEMKEWLQDPDEMRGI
ncbi:MAG TPA: TrkA family potassium uptake protein [Synergistaceae bacterium]|nr:TrkA family potassium uptake protein [Synergistaceae bacterium]HPQ36154.1 TrkA family potassium uptake protein [Synergistaceae bacterium]